MPVNITRWVWLSGLVLLMSGCDSGSDVVPAIQGTYMGLLNFTVGDEEIDEFWTLSLTETGG